MHIDLWRTHRSRISGTGCSSCVNKLITGKQTMRECKQLTWVVSWKWVMQVDNQNVWAVGNYIYAEGQSCRELVSELEPQPSQGRSRAEHHLQLEAATLAYPSWKAEGVLNGTLNMESMWLWVNIAFLHQSMSASFVSLSLSHFCQFLPFREIK